jgi:hypothetical protein
MHYHRGLIFGNFNVHQSLVRFIDSSGKSCARTQAVLDALCFDYEFPGEIFLMKIFKEFVPPSRNFVTKEIQKKIVVR